MNEKRLKILTASVASADAVLRGFAADSIPRLVETQVDDATAGVVRLKLWHPDWPVVPEGGVIPDYFADRERP